MILDGKKVRNEILDTLKEKVKKENIKATLAIILVGDDAPSLLYVKNKIKYASYVGIKTKLFHLESNVNESEVLNIIDSLNKDKSITGIILQSPTPDHIDFKKCVQTILPSKDVDGFTYENFYKLAHNMDGTRPCTPRGIIRLLEYYNIDLNGKNVAIVGRGDIVGKPLYFELLNKNATVCTCHSKTVKLEKILPSFDIIIMAIGKPKFLKKNMVKKGAIVIDVGITSQNGKIIGDVDFENVYKRCKYITPNPGGVGPMTIAMILENTINIYKGEK